jgi:hypothetical protein
MLNDELNSILKKFTAYVVQQSRSNLSRQGKNNTKGLYNSIKGGSKVSKNSIALWFEMKEHGEYQDKGVKGKKSSAKAPKSPFKFGTGTGRKGGLTEGIEKWVTRKRFQFKNKDGKFMSYKSTAWLITKSIYNKGLKPSMFFTKPFEKAYKSLPTELIDKYGLTMEDQLLNIIKDI